MQRLCQILFSLIINDDKNKAFDKGTLGEIDFQNIYNELVLKGFLQRDNLINLEYLKDRTKKRLNFPRIVHTGVELHPITFLFPKQGNPEIMLTNDFINNPFSFISK